MFHYFWILIMVLLSYLAMSFTCTDIDECENHNNCKLPRQTCINVPGNFMCSCIRGYCEDRSFGVLLCFTNHSSQVNLLVGKHTYSIAPSHVSVDTFLWNLHLIVASHYFWYWFSFNFNFRFFFLGGGVGEGIILVHLVLENIAKRIGSSYIEDSIRDGNRSFLIN